MQNLPIEIYYQILFYLEKNDIFYLLLTSKKINQISNSNSVWKYLFKRDFVNYSTTKKKKYLNVYQECSRFQCNAYTCIYPSDICPKNYMTFAHGPTCGNLWKVDHDFDSLNNKFVVIKLKENLWWFDIKAQTVLINKGRYKIYWRIKLEPDTVIDTLSCYHLYSSDDYSYDTYIHTLTIDFQNQLKQKGGWHLIHTGDVITRKSNVQITTHLFNQQGFFNGYSIDCVLFLPDNIKIV